MTMRVATFATSGRMLEAALRTQAKTVELEIQEASGAVSTDYGGLGADARKLVSLEVSVARAQSYADAASSAGDRIEVMYSACSSMTELLTELRAQLISATENVDDTGVGLTDTAAELLQEFAAQLNTQYEGRYLFAGSRTDVLPVVVDSATYPAATSPSSADTSYYQGDSTVAAVRVSADQMIDYGVTADDPAFEQSLRALNLVANVSTSPLDTAALDEALELVTDAVDAVLAVQAGLSVDADAMERAVANQEEYVDFASALVGDLNAVDVAAVAAALATYQAQLEASYSAIAKIQGLSLLDYLR